jgi:hypothetical protein
MPDCGSFGTRGADPWADRISAPRAAAGARDHPLCRAHRAYRHRERTRGAAKTPESRRAAADGGRAAGRNDHRAHRRRARLARHADLRHDRDHSIHINLRPLPDHEQSTLAQRAAIKARQGVELITPGELRVVDPAMCDVPRDGATACMRTALL